MRRSRRVWGGKVDEETEEDKMATIMSIQAVACHKKE